MEFKKLHKNIVAGFGVVWLIMTIVVLIALVRMSIITDRIEKITSEHNYKTAIAVEMRDIIYQRQLIMRNSLIYGDMFELEANRAKLGILAQQFVALRDELMKAPLNETEQGIIRDMQASVRTTNPLGRELTELSLLEGVSERSKYLTRKVTEGQLEVISHLNRLVAYQGDQINRAVEDTLATHRTTQVLILALGALAAALNLLVATLVVRHSRRQTRDMEFLSRFPSENPRPVMRVDYTGEMIYANRASQMFLDQWETAVGHMLPLEWSELVGQIAEDEIIIEREVVCGDRIYSLVMTPVPEAKYVNIYGHDITEREQIREEIAHLASHDSLTGLINRREFELALDRAIKDAQNSNSRHAFMYLDLDQFKVVNDTCGHSAGDEMLKQLAAVLRETIREIDKLGRLGGDEFGLLLGNCSLEKAERIAETLRITIENFRFVWKEKAFGVGVSIGVVPVTAASGNLSVVLSAADAACYVAKEMGRNRVHVSYPGDVEVSRHRGQIKWVQHIRDAINRNQFELYCQDIIPLLDNKHDTVHAEILLRLFDENGEPISPGTFIPAAERYDLMANVDRWVVQNSLPLLNPRINALVDNGSWFSINLSGQSIGDEQFLPFVIAEIQANRIPPGAICFEITETAAISHLGKAIEFIRALREMGCRFALDDFGSGLSSFSYLKNLKIDYLKIDGSFVTNMHEDRVSAAMVESITRVAHEMGIGVIAEWVENKETVDMLCRLGVEFAQGYALGRPYPLAHRQLYVAN